MALARQPRKASMASGARKYLLDIEATKVKHDVSGDRCELQGTCLTHPCERGECIQLSFDSHSCSCPKGYEGTRCEIRIDYCKRNPCLNGGSCESLIGEHKCHCINTIHRCKLRDGY
ncbi:EGF-like domain protein [Ostertagia ostertagi]